MYIPSTIPSSLSEMLDFLTPTILDGLFDSVEYDNESSPTKIVCTQNGNTILEISYQTNQWTFTPFISSGVSWHEVTVNISYTSASFLLFMRCKGGFGIVQRSQSTSYKWGIICGKASNEKTTCVMLDGAGNQADNIDAEITGSTVNCYTVTFGDDTSLAMATSLWQETRIVNADRTILGEIPVIGRYGSTDYMTTVYFRKVCQFKQNGAQIIGGRQYGCIYNFAILDE